MTSQPALISIPRNQRRPVRDTVERIGLLPLAHRLKRTWLRVADPRQLPELDGDRVVFKWLERHGQLTDMAGQRCLEVGPKHGRDSRLLAGLHPLELVLVDLPEKAELVRSWLPAVAEICPVRYEEANLLYLGADELARLGSFELVWCLGVVYYNVEQLRLMRRLYDLCAENGRVVVESSTARGRRLRNENVVQLHWPDPFNGVPTITHLPSRRALKSWLEMVGFVDVEICDVYSRAVGRNRAVATGRKVASSVGPYVSYANDGRNPVYSAGGAR